MKRWKVPIFTEEYAIEVRIGTKEEILKSAAKYLGVSLKAIENDYGNCRGRAWNALDKVYGVKNPIIVIDGDLPYYVATATLAHEASHAMDFIEDFIGLADPNGEFHGHGIAAVVRTTMGEASLRLGQTPRHKPPQKRSRTLGRLKQGNKTK